MASTIMTALGCIADVTSEAFESRYAAWKARMEHSSARLQSTAEDYVDNPEFQAMVDLGPSALPYLADKMESDASAVVLWHAIRRIAKVNIRSVYDADKRRVSFPDYPDLKKGGSVYLYWWREGRFQTGTKFQELYDEWKMLRAASKDKDADEVFRRIPDLGLPVLPYLVSIVDEDPAFIAAISTQTDGACSADATAAACRVWWKENETRFSLPPSPQAEPKADKDESYPKIK